MISLNNKRLDCILPMAMLMLMQKFEAVEKS